MVKTGRAKGVPLLNGALRPHCCAQTKRKTIFLLKFVVLYSAKNSINAFLWCFNCWVVIENIVISFVFLFQLGSIFVFDARESS